MGLSKGARERGLRGIIAGDLWVGLASAISGNAVSELDDPSYARQPAVFGDPVHQGSRSTVLNTNPIEFAFAFNSDKEIRHWFLIDSARGKGEVIATGVVDPQYMLEKKTSKLLTLSEAKGKKDLSPIYPRPAAGAKSIFQQGDVWLYIEEE